MEVHGRFEQVDRAIQNLENISSTLASWGLTFSCMPARSPQAKEYKEEDCGVMKPSHRLGCGHVRSTPDLCLDPQRPVTRSNPCDSGGHTPEDVSCYSGPQPCGKEPNGSLLSSVLWFLAVPELKLDWIASLTLPPGLHRSA